ncbi:hypothetical protein JF66_18875 [Cryobacterium sp. MLB-32]|nr:hypothetical protein JF66_18875 [Cryobacterium sp. MLB-32]
MLSARLSLRNADRLLARTASATDLGPNRPAAECAGAVSQGNGLRDDRAGQKKTTVGDVKEWGVMLAAIASFLSASLP